MKAFEIIIPCKGFAAGKSRLAPALTPHERAALCRCLFTRTVGIAIEAAGNGNVAVVSADAAVLALAAHHGVQPLGETGCGLNAALHGANALLLSRENDGKRGLIVLPIDLPLLSSSLLRNAAVRTAAVGIAPDAEETGTNLLVLAGDIRADFPFSFGPGSFDLHLRAARARGAAVTILRDRRLAFDLDRPADLAQQRSSSQADIPPALY